MKKKLILVNEYDRWLLRSGNTFFWPLSSQSQYLHGLHAIYHNSDGTKKRRTFLAEGDREKLRKYIWKIAVAYQDDVSVATNEEQEHLSALRKIYEEVKNQKMKLSKCNFWV